MKRLREALRQCRIVEDLLQLAKPTEKLKPIDVRQGVTQSVELIRTQWQGEQHGESALPPDCGGWACRVPRRDTTTR
jgi:hypothetical protein